MQEKYGFYQEINNQIISSLESIRKNIRLSIYDYRKDYEETKNLIQAFKAYSYFIKDYLPKIINNFINTKIPILVETLERDFNIENTDIMKHEVNFSFIISKYPLYSENNFLNDENSYYDFIDYIFRMIDRANIDYNSDTGYLEDYTNKNHPWINVDAYKFSISTSIKNLIDCYYNELQALELMEEEINILKEDYQIKDSKGLKL